MVGLAAFSLLAIFAAARFAEAADDYGKPTPSPGPGAGHRERGPAAKAPWIGEACKDDFATLCTTVPRDSPREEIVKCLKAHQETLSDGCSAAIVERTDEGPTVRESSRPSGHRNRRSGGEGMGGGGLGGSANDDVR